MSFLRFIWNFWNLSWPNPKFHQVGWEVGCKDPCSLQLAVLLILLLWRQYTPTTYKFDEGRRNGGKHAVDGRSVECPVRLHARMFGDVTSWVGRPVLSPNRCSMIWWPRGNMIPTLAFIIHAFTPKVVHASRATPRCIYKGGFDLRSS